MVTPLALLCVKCYSIDCSVSTCIYLDIGGSQILIQLLLYQLLMQALSKGKERYHIMLVVWSVYNWLFINYK